MRRENGPATFCWITDPPGFRNPAVPGPGPRAAGVIQQNVRWPGRGTREQHTGVPEEN